MAKAKNPIPEGFRTLTPHITVKGAADYIDFLKRAFGAVEVSRAPGPGGKLMHAEVRVGDSVLMVNDEFPEFGMPPIAAGCEPTMPLQDQFWGDRYGQVKDPFGFKWAIATRKEELTPEEMRQRHAAAFGGGA